LAVRGDQSDDRLPGGALRDGAISSLLAEIAAAPLREPPFVLAPGSRVGRYEVIRSVARGGFGAVYEAHDLSLNRLVALKLLHRTRAADGDAAREGEAAARLAHPNIAVLFDAGVAEDGAPFLVYERLHGETVEERLERGPVPVREALEIAESIARALAHAHHAGVVHRDLKPSNVFLTADGEVKVLDFGIALLLGRGASPAGTPAYMAPEQRRGAAEDARTDLYALGLLVVEMVTGAPDTPLARVPPSVRRPLASLLAEDPAARPRSAGAALAQIEAARRPLSSRRVRLAAALALLAAIAAAVGALGVREGPRSRAPVPAAPLASIAVLPFADLSPGKDHDYFAQGLADEILTALTHVDGLRVAGRTSSFAFHGKDVTVEQIGRALHVAAVLEGSVRAEGQRVRVVANIVNAADGYHLWSETYDRELTDVFAVQDEIARAVVAALAVKGADRAPSTEAYRTRDPEVHAQYLLGRLFWNRQDDKGRAVQAFEKALAREPTYAPAWAGLAIAVFDVGDRSQTAAGLEAGCRRGLAAARRAIELDPTLSEGFSTRGFLREVCRWDWEGAREDLQRALGLSPGDSYARRRWGVLQLALGRVPEATAALRTSIAADPLSALTWRWLGVAELAASNPRSARDALDRALEIRPDDPFALYLLATTALLEGDAGAALATIERGPRDDTDGLVVRALAEHARGHARASRRALRALEAKAARGDTYAPLDLARVHAGLGERDRALAWLERAVAGNVGDLWSLKTDPLLRAVRDDARYVALLRRMKLPVE
jgi:eukaryotic-like serine/threonine-protein kinase